MIRLAALLLLASAGLAETPAERGKRVVDEALATLGGKRFLAMQDRIEAGRAYSFYREQLSGLARAKIYTRYLTRPEPPEPGRLFVRERQNFGKKEEYGVLFDEHNNAYQITFRGARPVAEDLLQRYRESTLRNIFYILRQRLGEPDLILESQGSDIVGNQPVEVVAITDADNRTVRVMFHASTKLPVQQVFQRMDPKTREQHKEEAFYSKYRDVGGGVMWPFAIRRERDGEKIFEMFAETVTINQGLSDQLFLLPADLKVLPKAR